MTDLYVIEYENAHWCGGSLHCVVWADSEDEAAAFAVDHMETEQRELFSDEYEEEPNDEECAYSISSVELLSESDCAEFYRMADQRDAFYPCVNPEECVITSDWARYF